jgi:hypothetical protein
MKDIPKKKQLVPLEWPPDSVAVVTLSNTAPITISAAKPGPSCQCAQTARLAGARVTALASGVQGHCYEHACLDDIRNLVSGRAASGDTSVGDCDICIAEQSVRVSQPKVMIGNGIGGTCRRIRLIGRTATTEIAIRMAHLPPAALASMKCMLTEHEDLHLSTALDHDQAVSQTLFGDARTIKNCKLSKVASMPEKHWKTFIGQKPPFSLIKTVQAGADYSLPDLCTSNPSYESVR